MEYNGITILILACIINLVGTEIADSAPKGMHKMSKKASIIKMVISRVEDEMNSRLQSSYWYRVGKILAAYNEDMVGVKYYVIFHFHMTKCKKFNPNNSIQVCPLSDYHLKCNAQIWAREWLNRYQLIKFNCANKSKQSKFY